MKISNYIIKIAILFLITSSNGAIFIHPEAPNITANSFILIDYNSKKIIASKNPHNKRTVASLTKLMTAYVVFHRLQDNLITLNDEVTISKTAWKTGGSRSFLKVGATIKLKTILKGMIIQSGNDAAVALAEHVAGTETTFVALMNEYAKKLNMVDTNFENSSGLPHANQHSTSYDLSLLAIAIIKEFPDYYKWFSQQEFTHNKIKQRNRNSLLFIDKSVDGMKTGHTQKAGYCLITSAKRIDMRIISIVLGASSINNRVTASTKLLDYAFRFFETKKITTAPQTISVYKGNTSTIKAIIANDVHLTLLRGQFKFIKKHIKIKKYIIAPIKQGDKLGELVISIDNKIIKTVPLVANKTVLIGEFFNNLIDNIKLLFN